MYMYIYIYPAALKSDCRTSLQSTDAQRVELHGFAHAYLCTTGIIAIPIPIPIFIPIPTKGQQGALSCFDMLRLSDRSQ